MVFCAAMDRCRAGGGVCESYRPEVSRGVHVFFVGGSEHDVLRCSIGAGAAANWFAGANLAWQNVSVLGRWWWLPLILVALY